MKKRMRGVMATRTVPAAAAAGPAPADWPLARPFRIGDLEVPNRVVQAPLAGIGDQAFRRQAHRHGAGLVVSEMVASMGLHHGNRRTADMLAIHPDEALTAIQLFGTDPAVMAEAARAAWQAGAVAVDVNMGCPVPKICRTGAGAALLADPRVAARIVRAMADAVPVPVTVKMRRGLTPRDARPAEAARIFADAGAAAIAFHPRAAAEEYAGRADHAITAEVVRAVRIPVMASGDITTAEEARRVHEDTGCAAVMIGRAALGDPWILRAMATGEPSARPDLAGVVAEVRAFAADARAAMGDHRACHHLRKFYPWYLAGEDVPQRAIAELVTAPGLDDALAHLDALAAGEPRLALAHARGLD